MNILVYGGYGILGSRLVKLLRKEHTVFVIDEYGDVDNEDPYFRGMTLRDLEILCASQECPKVIVDLTDSSNKEQLDDSRNFSHMVFNCARIMEICRIHSDVKMNPITMFYGTWEEPICIESSVFAYCSHVRKDLFKYYNKCNTVITRLDIPRLISGEYPASLFSSIISRILDGIEGKQQIKNILFDGSELTAGSLKWSTPELAAKQICSSINRRTRAPIALDGTFTTIPNIIGTLLDIVAMDSIEIYNPRVGKYVIDRELSKLEGVDDVTIRRWVNRAIEEYYNDNTETSPD